MFAFDKPRKLNYYYIVLDTKDKVESIKLNPKIYSYKQVEERFKRGNLGWSIPSLPNNQLSFYEGTLKKGRPVHKNLITGKGFVIAPSYKIAQIAVKKEIFYLTKAREDKHLQVEETQEFIKIDIDFEKLKFEKSMHPEGNPKNPLKPEELLISYLKGMSKEEQIKVIDKNVNKINWSYFTKYLVKEFSYLIDNYVDYMVWADDSLIKVLSDKGLFRKYFKYCIEAYGRDEYWLYYWTAKFRPNSLEEIEDYLDEYSQYKIKTDWENHIKEFGKKELLRLLKKYFLETFGKNYLQADLKQVLISPWDKILVLLGIRYPAYFEKWKHKTNKINRILYLIDRDKNKKDITDFLL